MKRPERKLVLENGQEFRGIGFGANENYVGEVIFNTSVVGYQEIMSDPSYAGQIVVMTYPLIGNYGITDEDFESRAPIPCGLIVRECCDTPSNFRFTKTLEEELEDRGISCVSGVDTRKITRIIRKQGRMRGAIVDAGMPVDDALDLISATPGDKNVVSKVSCRKRWLSRTPNHSFDVVAVDCGIKHTTVRLLNERGCNVTIVPFNTDARDICAFHPDGILFTSGPGSPYDIPEVSALIESLKGRYPILALGLSHELLALSYGAGVENTVCGLHGDHPVKDLATGRINIGVLDQSFCVTSLEGTRLNATHTVVPEGCIVGFECPEDKVLSVQFQPEAAPGPADNIEVFDRFVKMMEEERNA